MTPSGWTLVAYGVFVYIGIGGAIFYSGRRHMEEGDLQEARRGAWRVLGSIVWPIYGIALGLIWLCGVAYLAITGRHP